jgi:hypothetical protein
MLTDRLSLIALHERPIRTKRYLNPALPTRIASCAINFLARKTVLPVRVRECFLFLGPFTPAIDGPCPEHKKGGRVLRLILDHINLEKCGVVLRESQSNLILVFSPRHDFPPVVGSIKKLL